MLIACPFCEGQMEVADDIRTTGANFACPHCEKAISMSPQPSGATVRTAPPQQPKQKFSFPKLSLPKLSLPKLFLPGAASGAVIKVLGGLVLVALVVVVVMMLTGKGTCAATTPKDLREEVLAVFTDLHAIDRARQCEKLLEDRATLDSAKPFQLEQIDETGKTCREVSTAKPSKRRQRCEKFADRMVGLMKDDTKVDLTGTKKKMISVCLREHDPGVIDCALKAETLEAAKACEKDAKGGTIQKRPENEYAGLILSDYGDCKAMEESLPKKIAEYEASLTLEIKLHCDDSSEPTLVANDAVHLMAARSTTKQLPKVVRAVAEQKTTSDIEACYFDLKEQILDANARHRQLQCTALQTEIELLGANLAVESAVFDRIIERYGLTEKFEKHTAEDVVGWTAAVENSTVAAYVNAFLLSSKEDLCGEAPELTMKELHEAAVAAGMHCM
jgi:hypothetical protein